MKELGWMPALSPRDRHPFLFGGFYGTVKVDWAKVPAAVVILMVTVSPLLR